jgi:hypothetical protein
MKKICLLMILILTGAVVAVIGFHEPEPILPVPIEATELPALSSERLRAEEQGREVLRVYILGRVSVEKIAREEIKENDTKAALRQESREYWQAARKKAEDMKEMLSNLGSVAQRQTEKKVSMFSPLLGRASASVPLDRKKEVELTEERKRIIASYADYPYVDNLQILAEQIEYDADLSLELLTQAEAGKLSVQQVSSKLAESCRIKLTAAELGSSLAFPRPEGHEAFAWFWGGTETFVRVAPQGTILLLGKLPDIVFITGDTEIKMGEKPLSALDLDAIEQKYTGTASH